MQIHLKSAYTFRAEWLESQSLDGDNFDKYATYLHRGMHEENARAIQLAKEQGKNGCFAVHQPEGKHSPERYYLISPDIESGKWRSTSYDANGFPIGHHVDKWETLVIETVKHGRHFVADIPVANYSTDPKETILARYDTSAEQENDFLTLLLFWHLSHSEIQQHRKNT